MSFSESSCLVHVKKALNTGRYNGVRAFCAGEKAQKSVIHLFLKFQSQKFLYEP